jgi:hypothetical protein
MIKYRIKELYVVLINNYLMESSQMIIRAGDPLPTGVTARTLSHTPQLPVRLDVDLGNPA